MKHSIVIPSLGLVEVVTVTAWTKASGDRVQRGETLCTVETEKSEVLAAFSAHKGEVTEGSRQAAAAMS